MIISKLYTMCLHNVYTILLHYTNLPPVPALPNLYHADGACRQPSVSFADSSLEKGAFGDMPLRGAIYLRYKCDISVACDILLRNVGDINP